MAEDNVSRQALELEALRAIYCDDGQVVAVSDSEWRLRLEPPSQQPAAYLEVHLPCDYPSTSAPTPIIEAPGLSAALHAEIAAELLGLFEAQEVVVQWVECLRERLAIIKGDEEEGHPRHEEEAVIETSSEALSDLQLTPLPDEFTFVPSTSHYGQRTRRFDAASALAGNEVPIVHGQPITPPGKSTFQAHLARVTSGEQVQSVLRRLLQDRKVARATHNIFAYRFYDAERGVQVSDNDDDGENAAGGRLAALLELMDANDVLIVVSRWFGGILLGPDRFKYISNCARSLLEQEAYGGTKDKRPGGPRSRR